jgi:hypothetical protein
MAGMELLQFHKLLYWALQEFSADYEAPAALPREQKPPYLLNGVLEGAVTFIFQNPNLSQERT